MRPSTSSRPADPARRVLRLPALLLTAALVALAVLFAPGAQPSQAQNNPTVSLQAVLNPVPEGSPAELRIMLSAALTTDVALSVTATAVTAEPGDVAVGTFTVTIPAGLTTVTLPFTTTTDLDTADETFTVTLGSLPSGVTAGATTSLTFTITDDGGIPWSATLTVRDLTSGGSTSRGCTDSAVAHSKKCSTGTGTLSDHDFTLNGNDFTVVTLREDHANSRIEFGISGADGRDFLRNYILTIGAQQYRMSDATTSTTDYLWTISTTSWTVGQTLSVSLRQVPAVWRGSLNVQAFTGVLGCEEGSGTQGCGSTSVLSDDDFTLSGTTFEVNQIFLQVDSSFRSTGVLDVYFDPTATAALKQHVLVVGSRTSATDATFKSVRLPLSSATVTEVTGPRSLLSWRDTGIHWASAADYTLTLESVPTISFSETSYSVDEGDGPGHIALSTEPHRAVLTTKTITLNISPAMQQDSYIFFDHNQPDWYDGGTDADRSWAETRCSTAGITHWATATIDYWMTNAYARQIALPAGATSVSFDIKIIADTEHEENEQFPICLEQVRLSTGPDDDCPDRVGMVCSVDSTHYTISTPRVLFTITDDDPEFQSSDKPQKQIAEYEPGMVYDLSATTTPTTATVNWSAPQRGGEATGYIAHIRPVGEGKGKITKRPDAPKTHTTFKNLTPGATYKVWVRAQNDAGKGLRRHITITLPTEEPAPTPTPEPTPTPTPEPQQPPQNPDPPDPETQKQEPVEQPPQNPEPEPEQAEPEQQQQPVVTCDGTLTLQDVIQSNTDAASGAITLEQRLAIIDCWNKQRGR